VNGLSGFPDSLDIVAHANSAKHMAAANETADEKIPLPDETFYNRMRMSCGDLDVDLFYFGPAHTDGDIVLYVPVDNVAIIGDLFFKDRDPLIHMHKNGSSSGLTDVLGEVVALDAKTYLSGHAEPVSKHEIEDLRKKILQTQEDVMAMVVENKSLGEVKQAMGISTEESRWRSLAEVIYLELTE
jgi:glyoxylase-like metal-dependent hydrolase (beta-lactamase superfamily II)